MTFLIVIVAGLFPFWGNHGLASKAARPVVTPSGFTSANHGAQTVTVTSSTPGAQIRYTKDSTNPTFTNGTLINSGDTAFVGAHVETDFRAVAFTSASDVSDIQFELYDFTPGGGP